MNNRLPTLLNEKQRKENRIITYAVLAHETGISAKTLVKWQFRRVKRFDGETVEVLCRYFGCGLSDLLRLGD